MTGATIASAGAGAALPLMNIIFGRLVGSFNNYFIPGSGVSEAEFRSSVNQNSLYIVYLFIGKLVLGYISTYAFRMTGIRISAAIRMAYLTALFNQPMSAIDKLPSGTATDSLTTVANTIQMAVSDKLGALVQGSALIIAAYIVAFKYSWSLTLVSSSAILFVCIVTGTTAPFFFKCDRLVAESNSGAAAVVSEALRAIRTVKSLSAESQLKSKYNRWINEAQERGLKKSIWVTAQFWPVFFSMYANMALTFWFGIKLYMRDDIANVGTVVVVLFSVLIVLAGIGQIFAPLQNISKASAAAGACFKIIDAPQLNHGGLKEPEVKQELDIRFENVSFAYPSRPQASVLSNLSFTLPAGKVTAFVGQSGCGKSTIVALLERWYELSDVNEALPKLTEELEAVGTAGNKAKKGEKVHSVDMKQEQEQEQGEVVVLQNSGNVYYGPHNIETLDRKWWRSQIGLVQQEPVLFNETIYENVVKGLIGSLWEHEEVSSKVERVKEACREAFADEFITHLPDGYDTLVGESGIKLSGGQRQRLAIARAIIKRPSILILDEATSSLDVRGERLVAAALERASKGRTTIVIAHRMSTIRNADHIVVLKEGSAVEEGTHTELEAKENGVYANLLRAQHVALSVQEDANEDQPATLLPRDLAEESERKSFSRQEQAQAEDTKPTPRGFIRSVGVLLYEQRHHRIFYLLILLAAMGAGSAYAFQAYIFSHLIVVFQETGNQLVSGANFWALMIFILAICVGICYGVIGWTSNSLSVYVGTACRQDYFDSVLHKSIAFFDKESHSVGTLTGQLSTDPQQLQDIVGGTMIFPLIAVFNLTSCTIISFVFGWKLTLVIFFAALPVILGAAFFRIRYELVFEAMNAKVRNSWA
jgi:ABC-type multidrug transport system fused ATPase/permease subunit